MIATSNMPRATGREAVHTYNGTELYGYDPSGQRVWKQEQSRTLVYFYGIEGNLLRTLGDGDDTDSNAYFGGKLIWRILQDSRTPRCNFLGGFSLGGFSALERELLPNRQLRT